MDNIVLDAVTGILSIAAVYIFSLILCLIICIVFSALFGSDPDIK